MKKYIEIFKFIFSNKERRVKMKKIIILVLLSNYFFIIAQDKKVLNIKKEIYRLLTDDKKIGDFVGYGKYRLYNDNNFLDPYGTLDDCVLFIMSQITDSESEIPREVNGNFYFGIYKNKKIIWLSEPIYSSGYIEGSFVETKDINNDGNVEIIYCWSYCNIDGSEEQFMLNIVSWNGTEAVFINDGGLETKLISQGYYHVIDLDSDGVYEIVTDTVNYYSGDELKKGKLVYSYNGNLYGDWINGVKFPTPEDCATWPYTAANKIMGKIDVSVKKEEQSFQYVLKVKNLNGSQQKISAIFFEYPFDSMYYLYPFGDNYHSTRLKSHPIWGFTIEGEQDAISSNDSIVYKYRNKNLPQISQYYLQADYDRMINYDFDDANDFIPDEFDDNVINNSLKIKSIAPGLLSMNLNQKKFIDTLKSYNTQSYELGWIKEESVLTKYNNYLTTAKNYLIEGDSTSARNELQLVLNDCIADSSTVLTSEAFALLYFNTEYLIKQLPVKKRKL